MLSVNKELLQLYWDIGNDILVSQAQEKWGAKVIPKLSKDLKSAFPDMRGFSERNLKYMRQFAEVYKEWEFVQVPLAQITWYHNIALLFPFG